MEQKMTRDNAIALHAALLLGHAAMKIGMGMSVPVMGSVLTATDTVLHDPEAIKVLDGGLKALDNLVEQGENYVPVTRQELFAEVRRMARSDAASDAEARLNETFGKLVEQQKGGGSAVKGN